MKVNPEDVAYGIDGGLGGPGIYDGIIVWVLKDGTRVNRFAGTGTAREARIDDWLRQTEAEYHAERQDS